MRKGKKLAMGLLAMMMAVTMAAPAMNVDAAAKKLSVNRVYEGSTRIKGKTKKKYTVKVKIGKKTYKAKANKKGKFSIKIPKVKTGKKYTVKSYKGKKYYTKKTVYVIAKKVKVNSYKPTSKTISGYTRPSYKVKVTINGKTYKAKASKTSGKFSVRLKKKAGTGKASVKVYNTKGKKFTSTTKTHSHVWKKQYKTVHHNAVGHWETVTVPAWDEKKETYHYVCLKDGRDLTQDYLDSVKNKTYPEYDDATKKEWGWTVENGYPKIGYDALVFTNNNMEVDKFAPTFSMYMGLQGWNGECDGHNYGSELVYVKVHHLATTKQEWKVDQKAYTEKVFNGYRCDCGTKK